MADQPVPERYQPDYHPHEDKDWLQELYWGEELLSAAEIAERCDVSKSQINRKMREFGIPKRPTAYASTNSTSPFAGFYGANEPAPDDDPSATEYDPEFEQRPSETMRWEHIAKTDPAVKSVGGRSGRVGD